MEWKFTEEGDRVRVSLRTGRIIPKPIVERRDGIVPQQWKGDGLFVNGETFFSAIDGLYPVLAARQLVFPQFSTLVRLAF